MLSMIGCYPAEPISASHDELKVLLDSENNYLRIDAYIKLSLELNFVSTSRYNLA